MKNTFPANERTHSKVRNFRLKAIRYYSFIIVIALIFIACCSANIRPHRQRILIAQFAQTCCHLSRTATGDSDNENSIAALTPTERIKISREKERQIFKHLLSLDIVAMSFINFIASAREADRAPLFVSRFEFYVALIMRLPVAPVN